MFCSVGDMVSAGGGELVRIFMRGFGCGLNCIMEKGQQISFGWFSSSSEMRWNDL